LTEDNVAVLRPGNRDAGLHPKFYDEIVGETAARSIGKAEGLQWDDVCT